MALAGRGLVAVGLALALTGCGFGACDTSVQEAVVVTAQDSLSHADITDSLRGTISWDAYTDSLHIHSEDSTGQVTEWAGGPDRNGTYAVHLERSGYMPYDRAGIYVSDGDCHAEQRHIIAKMVPTS
jgi:hypothetical protein